MSMHVLIVNDTTYEIDVDPRTPLLYVLRNDLGIISPKFGCGLSECGACTVLADGRPVRACCVPVGSLASQKIVTVEGLGTPERPHPLQQAFIDEQAAQCGYCIPGMLMSAQALLAQNSSPTDEQVRQALAGNLCGCGTHIRIVKAIQRAAGIMRREEGRP
ncbi:(2Fe-2S)-binding protein [Pseudomonas asuensis]|jgi:nicotinate dehydrogenase subunit A|uniref:Oxidoreductase n=1 Tax=Pseudomonas asuensis TaxID=1825787 RepID=A0ABQ2H1G3_9PSED|nr:(2Fe-2S)-binding protein [Pseudomonas asuensis]GGM22706.1 oxidoreductase [Pseudomonas asuensis]